MGPWGHRLDTLTEVVSMKLAAWWERRCDPRVMSP